MFFNDAAKELENRLSHSPETIVTVILLLLAAFAVVVAFKGNVVEKATVAGWFIMP